MIRQDKQSGSTKPILKRNLLFILIVVAILAGLIAVLVFWFQERPQADTAEGAPQVSEGDLEGLIRASLKHLEQPTLKQGLLHEQYRITTRSQSWQIERWIDFAQPEHLALFIRRDGETSEPFYSVKTDGVDRLEMIDNDIDEINNKQRISSTVPGDLLKQIRPILLQTPYTGMPGFQKPPHIERLFLNLALQNNLSSLGTSQFLSRPATTIRYSLNPKRFSASMFSSSEYEQAEVLLTIDNQTYSLLQVELTFTGQAGSESLTPWRAELFSFDDQADPELFTIADVSNDMFISPRLALDQEFLLYYPIIAPHELLERTDTPIYLPPALAEELVWGRAFYAQEADDELITLSFESADRMIMYVSLSESLLEERPPISYDKESGKFSYMIDGNTDQTVVHVINNETGHQFSFYIYEPFAIKADQEREIKAWISTLEALTPDNFDRFQANMFAP